MGNFLSDAVPVQNVSLGGERDMGLTDQIRGGIFGVSESNTTALKHGTLLVMNLELISMFLSGTGSYTLLVCGGLVTGLLCRGTLKTALWHGLAAGVMGGFVISFVFAGQYGALGWKVNPKLLVTLLGGDLYWLYELTPIVAFVGIIGLVVVDVMIGAGIAGAVRTGIDQLDATDSEGAATADE
jgi:hypothetical protein